MKISVSLPERDVALLDEYARVAGLPSRSAAMQRAVGMLRNLDLEDDYAAAFDEWEASGEHDTWGVTAADGLADVAR